MALRLAGERALAIQGTDNQGWVREVTIQDSLPGLKINQKGAGRVFDFQDGGASKMYLPDGGDVTLSSGLVFAGGNITGGSGFTIATSAGDMNLSPAGEIATAKRYVPTLTTPFRLRSTTNGPWRSDLFVTKQNIGDNVLKDIIAVTVPNVPVGLSAFILVDWIVRTGGDRSSESGQIRVDIARRDGAATAKAIAVTLAGVEQQSGPYAEGLAVTWSVDANVGADTATQTFNIEVTVDSDAGGNPAVQVYARVLSGGGVASESGAEVTIAAAA